MLSTHPETQPDLLHRLAAYIPTTLTREILTAGLPVPGEPRSLLAATLFSDISGFTTMSEELATDGPRGAEELNRVLLITFTAMIDVIHQMGGAVSHFYGDAMSVYFPDNDGQAAVRALACAQMMQQLMLVSFERVVTNRPPGKNPFFHLTIKIGVGYGRCQELVVGDPASSLEFVLTGPAVDEAAMAEKQASAGQVVASRAVLAQTGLPTTADFSLVTTPLPHPPATPILDWDSYDEAALRRLAAVIGAFIPTALYERIVATSQESLAEHRPVTSLFVQFEVIGDVDESSAIETVAMGRQLQAYYQWVNQVVARFSNQNARLNRVLTGDKGNQLHIMFGAPVAPDAPEQAVRCALALQREQPDFIASQRIGLAVGKVFAGPVGSSSRREYTVVGDVVNLSARLMQICERGMVLTDQLAAERTRDFIAFEPLPPVQLKGKQAAITPYRARRDQSATTQLQTYFSRWQRPLVNREQELEALLDNMDLARRGSGRVVAIAGPAGVGKTRLLAAAALHWLEAGGTGFLGVCHQHTADNPYSPWRNIWQDLFGLRSDMDAEAQVAVVIEQTHRLAPESGDDTALWGEVLGLPLPLPDSLLALPADVRQARFFALVRRCFRAVAQTRPLLLVLENLHWVDQASLALLDDLTLHLETWPVFVALTYRPTAADIPAETLSRPLCLPINLADLSPEQARDLLQQLLGVDKLPLTIEQQAIKQHLGLCDREGEPIPVNPLFLEEALHVMIGVGVLEVNGRVRVNEDLLSQMQLPDTIHGLLLARLDRLPPISRDLLQVASVIGREFPVEPLHTITPNVSREMVYTLMAQLSDEELTQLVTADPEWIYLFQHAMTHEVAYESLSYARRQVLHAAVANWLVHEYQDNLKPYHPILAYHYSRAGLHSEALRFALAGADDARAIFANREAVELYKLAERHLQILGEAEWWETAVHLYLSRSESLRFIGNLSAAVADLEKAVALCQEHQDDRHMAQAYILLAEMKYRQARHEEAQGLARIVIEQWPDLLTSDEMARAYLWAGMAASSLLEYDLALTYLREAEKICLATNNNSRLAHITEGIGFVYYFRRDLESALAAMQRSVQLSRNFGNPANLASALNNIALVQFTLGQPEAALATFDEAIGLVRETSRNFLAQFLGNRAEVLTYLGRFAAALENFEEANSLFEAMDDEAGLVEIHLLWGYEYCSQLGQWEEARRHFRQAEALIALRPDDYPEEKARLLLGFGQVALTAGDTGQADALLREAEAIIADKGLAWWRPAVCYFGGLTRLAQAKTAEAQTYFQQGIQAVEQEGCPDYLPLILWQLAACTSDDTARLVYLERCVRAAQQRARYLDRRYCFIQAGSLLINSEDANLRQLGEACLRQVEASELTLRAEK